MTAASELARWASGVTFDALPRDVIDATTLRVLDVIGLALAGSETDFGRSTRGAAVAMSPPGPCRVLAFGDRVGVASAAFANAALAQALEYDDTHNESIVHMSSPSVATALALSETLQVSGRDFITAVALGSVTTSPDGRFVYVTSEEDSQVTVIDGLLNTVVTQFDVGARPRSSAFLPDSSRVR